MPRHMKSLLCLAFIVAAAWFCAIPCSAAESAAVIGPTAHAFAKPGGIPLTLYVFAPTAPSPSAARPAIVLFHGGGWVIGEPAWAFGRAHYFSEHGMVAVTAQYRLSDEKSVTPIEAMADARTAIRWVRSHARELGVDPGRIAAYGWSAGGHLAACAATIGDPSEREAVSCVPNALVLESPAVAAGSDEWFRHLVGSRDDVRHLSPDENVRPGLPPTIIVEGRTDTVTPLAGVQRFADRMRAAGNRCDLYVFDGAGHLFTPVGNPDNGIPKPDPAIEQAAFSKLDGFLRELGYFK